MHINTNIIKNGLSRRVGGYKDGWFVTIDTNKFESDMDREKLYTFVNNKVPTIVSAMDKFCFGRSGKKLKVAKAIEFGNDTRRLHIHMMMLHRGDCDRTLCEFKNHLFNKVIFPVVRMRGASAIDVKSFDPNEDWVNYFVKSTNNIHSKFGGFLNIE